MITKPNIHSKGMTYHGKPHVPAKVTKPGGQAEKSGHVMPREVAIPHEAMRVTRK